MIFNFTLPFPPSSNSIYPTVKRGSKTIRVKSQKYKDWIASCPPITQRMKHNKCVIEYDIYFPDDRVRDGQSYMKTVLDYLVFCNFLNDDNRNIVKGESWMDCGNDKDNPRIEIKVSCFQ